MTRTPQETATYALTRAVHYADQAASHADGGPTRTKEYASQIASFTGLASVYAEIAKAAATVSEGDNT